MAHSIHRERFSSQEAINTFGDQLREHEPSILEQTHPFDDARTSVSGTGVIPAQDLSPKPDGVTEAQEIISQYNQRESAATLAVNDRSSQYDYDRHFSGYPSVSYVDDAGYQSTRPQSYAGSSASLVDKAPGRDRYSGHFQDMEYAEPPAGNDAVTEKSTSFNKFLGNGSGKYPLDQRIEDKKRGIGRQRYPVLVWALTAVMIAVFIYELVVNSRAQGTPVSFKPVVNPMLGPSESALIYVGARFPPCMKTVQNITSTTTMPCLNDTANPPTSICPVEDICGFGGFNGGTPNQWFRFITPIFIHAGFIHIILNMIAQLTVSAQIEREMGSAGFLLTYLAAGIFGNVLGGNFSLVGAPSVGASGAIFGAVAVTWVDLFAHWRYHYRPGRKLAFMSVELIFGIALGYIPYVDNFAHLGGLCMGLLVGTALYPVISPTRKHKAVMWGFRIAAVPLAIILFVVLVRNFYTSDPYAACSGCRYLSCIPTSSNNHCQGTGLTYTTGGSSSI